MGYEKSSCLTIQDLSLSFVETSGSTRIFWLRGTAGAPEFGLGHLQKIMYSYLFLVEADSYTVRTNGSRQCMVGKYFSVRKW